MAARASWSKTEDRQTDGQRTERWPPLSTSRPPSNPISAVFFCGKAGIRECDVHNRMGREESVDPYICCLSRRCESGREVKALKAGRQGRGDTHSNVTGRPVWPGERAAARRLHVKPLSTLDSMIIPCRAKCLFDKV